MNIPFEIYTMPQLLLACGLARNISRTRLCRDIEVTNQYITKMIKFDEFNLLVNAFRAFPLDDEIREYVGKKTLLLTVAKVLYAHAEKL